MKTSISTRQAEENHENVVILARDMAYIRT
jgi:hypothetical protein